MKASMRDRSEMVEYLCVDDVVLYTDQTETANAGK